MGINVSKSQQENINNSYYGVTNVANQTCLANVSNSLSDVTLILNGDFGDVSIVQSAEADVNCIMDSNIDLIAQTLIDQAQDNLAKTGVGILPITPLGFNISVSSQTNATDLGIELKNNIYQICSSTVENRIDNVLINIVGSADSVTVGQSGNANSECVLTNLAKLDAQTQVNQSNQNTSGGRTSLLTVAIVFIIAVAIIIALVVILRVLLGGRKKGKGGEAEDICESLTGEAKATCEIKRDAAPKVETAGTKDAGISVDQLSQLLKLVS